MECASFIEHAVAVEHLVRQKKVENGSVNCSDLDSAIGVTSGSLCFKNRSYIFPVQFWLGICGNLLIICVFSRKTLRNITNYFLCCIAMADIGFFLSLSMSSAIVFPSLRDSVVFQDFYFFSYPYLLMLANFFSSLSLWSSVGVTTQQLIAVCYPLKVELIFSQHRLYTTSLLVCIVSIALSSFKIYQGTDILLTCDHHPPSTSLNLKLISVLFLAVLVFIPIILVISLNVLLVIALRNNKQQLARRVRRSNLASLRTFRKRSDQKITVLVMLTTLTLVTLNTPSLIINTLKVFYGMHWLTRQPTVILPLSNILVATDKMLHFFFFCCFSSKFRRGLKSMLLGHDHSKASITSSIGTRWQLSESGHSYSTKKRRLLHHAAGEQTFRLLSATCTPILKQKVGGNCNEDTHDILSKVASAPNLKPVRFDIAADIGEDIMDKVEGEEDSSSSIIPTFEIETVL